MATSSFADLMKSARATAAGTAAATDPAVVAPPAGSSAPAVGVNTAPVATMAPAAAPQPASANAEMEALRRELAESRASAESARAKLESDLRAEADARERAAMDRARTELGVDSLHAELTQFREAAKGNELADMIQGLQGNEDLPTEQVQAIAKAMEPLLKKLHTNANTPRDDKRIGELQAELQALRDQQAASSKLTVQDRVTARAKEQGVNVDSLLDDDRYKRLLKDRIPGSRQTHGQALYEMLNAGDVEDAAAKLAELQGLIKPDYAKAAATTRAATHGTYVGADPAPAQATPNPNDVASDLMRKLRGGEISRTEHSKQVRDAFHGLFAATGR